MQQPERTTTTYRGYELVQERMGHVNVQTDRGFVGGYPSLAEARRAVDWHLDKPTYVRVGVNAYAQYPGGRHHVVEYRDVRNA